MMLFYVSLALCVLGWVFLGLGVILFPLSLFILFRSNSYGSVFSLITIANITGFSTSFYLVGKKILQFYLA